MAMTEKKILEATHLYADKLLSAGAVPEQSDEPRDRALWCCSQIPQLLTEGRREKVMRWLGFVHGVLFTLKLMTIDEIKDSVRPDPEETYAPRDS